MNISENIPLSRFSAMRLGGPARYITEIKSARDIEPALEWAKVKKLKAIMIGGGTNIIWTDKGFDGLVLVNQISGFKLEQNDEHATLTVGAGEVWDKVVARTVAQGLSGIEQLSLIPGTVGGTPVQNVGAYGREISDVLINLEAYDTKAKKIVTIKNKDCDFGYRMSRFKSNDRGRFFITSITLSLSKEALKPPFYPSLQKQLDEQGTSEYTPQAIREAVIAVRSSKLPDPSVVANCGSFFANPITTAEKLEELLVKFPGLPNWDMQNGQHKISAGWILDYLGYKDFHDDSTGMATWRNHALVLVNERAKDTKDLIEFRNSIIERVQKEFGITLEQEPELI